MDMKHLIFALVGLLVATFPALAQDGYRIKAGDVLRIEVLEDPNLNRSALVLPDGRISVPLAGALQAGGRTIEEVQADLAARLAPNFAAAPNVFIGVDQIAKPAGSANGVAATARGIEVYVMGEALKPGKLSVKPGTTILQFLAEMGGFTKFAATKRIQLRRTVKGEEKVYLLNYDAITRGAANTLKGRVANGDVIIVPQRQLFE
jgi:polysaccharide export outer membrane protein